MKKIWDNLIKNITSFEFKVNLFFIFSCSTYIYLSYYLFTNDIRNNNYFNQNLSYLTLITKNLEQNFKEKNLEIKFENNTYSLNQTEPLLLENFNKEITDKKNLVYIAKDASDKDFNEKNSFMILNEKELKIQIGNEPLVYPIESIVGITKAIDYNQISKFNQEFYKGSELFNRTGLNIIIMFKALEIVFLLFIGNYLLIYLVYGILYLSGYKSLNAKNYRTLCVALLGVYLILKAPFTAYFFEPSLLSTLLIIAVAVAILEKRKIEKN